MLRRASILICLIAVLASTASLGVASSYAELSSNAAPGIESAGSLETEAEKREKEANNHARSGSSSGPSAIVIAAIVGGVVLLGIAFLIVRDARKVAPVPEGPSEGAVSPESRAAAIRRRRNRGKAARQARKRNR